MTSAFHCVRYPSQFGITALGTESRIHLPPLPGLQTLCPLLSAAFRSHDAVGDGPGRSAPTIAAVSSELG